MFFSPLMISPTNNTVEKHRLVLVLKKMKSERKQIYKNSRSKENWPDSNNSENENNGHNNV